MKIISNKGLVLLIFPKGREYEKLIQSCEGAASNSGCVRDIFLFLIHFFDAMNFYEPFRQAKIS
jgi:hypothetical protein